MTLQQDPLLYLYDGIISLKKPPDVEVPPSPNFPTAMLSVTEQDSTIPEVYCQLNEQNEVLGSLMSSVFQRSVLSPRCDRNQLRQVSVKQERLFGGIVATQYVPRGIFRSKIVITVISGPNRTDNAFLSYLIRISTNRGHTIVGFSASQESEWSQIK